MLSDPTITCEIPLYCVSALCRAVRSGRHAISAVEMKNGDALSYSSRLDTLMAAVLPLAEEWLLERGWFIGKLRDIPISVPKPPQGYDPDDYLIWHPVLNIYKVLDSRDTSISAALMHEREKDGARSAVAKPVRSVDKNVLVAEITITLKRVRQRVRDLMNQQKAYDVGAVERIEAAALNEIVDHFTSRGVDTAPATPLQLQPGGVLPSLSNASGLRTVCDVLLRDGYVATATPRGLCLRSSTLEVELMPAEERIVLRHTLTGRGGELQYTTPADRSKEIIAHVLAGV